MNYILVKLFKKVTWFIVALEVWFLEAIGLQEIMPCQFFGFLFKKGQCALLRENKWNYSTQIVNCLPQDSETKPALISTLGVALNNKPLLNVCGQRLLPSLQNKRVNNLKCQLQITNKTDCSPHVRVPVCMRTPACPPAYMLRGCSPLTGSTPTLHPAPSPSLSVKRPEKTCPDLPGLPGDSSSPSPSPGNSSTSFQNTCSCLPGRCSATRCGRSRGAHAASLQGQSRAAQRAASPGPAACRWAY